MTFLTWVHMHGYAVYLWPGYGLVTLVLVGHLFASIWQGRRVRNLLRKEVQ